MAHGRGGFFGDGVLTNYVNEHGGKGGGQRLVKNGIVLHTA